MWNLHSIPSLTDTLAVRLENEGNGELSPYAGLCYICSGNVEKMVENWFSTSQNSNSPMALQVNVVLCMYFCMYVCYQVHNPIQNLILVCPQIQMYLRFT